MSNFRKKDTESSEIWNSSFYSSKSIDSSDHVSNFRNSLLLPELNAKHDGSESGESFEQDEGEFVQDGSGMEGLKNETKTMNMTTSPSLSALAGILNEKAKQADKKMRSSVILNSSILEEEEEDGEHEDEEEDGKQEEEESNKNSIVSDNVLKEKKYDVDDELKPPSYQNSVSLLNPFNNVKQQNVIDSPNLIDLHDGKRSMKIPVPVDRSVFEQPDFLSSPNPNSLPQSHMQEKRKPHSFKSLVDSGIESTGEVSPAKLTNELLVNTATRITGDAGKVTTEGATQATESVKKLKKQSHSKSLIDSGKPVNKKINEPFQTRSNEKSRSKKFEKKSQELSPTKSLPISSSHKERHSPSSFHASSSDKKKLSSPSNQAQNNKRKSIFSFLRIKSYKNDTSSDDGSKRLSPSSTFSFGQAQGGDHEKLTKKSHSSNSIFNQLRKKDNSPTKAALPKVRSKSTAKSSDIPIKKQVFQRKPTPLDFEGDTEKKSETESESDFESSSSSDQYENKSYSVEEEKTDEHVTQNEEESVNLNEITVSEQVAKKAISKDTATNALNEDDIKKSEVKPEIAAMNLDMSSDSDKHSLLSESKILNLGASLFPKSLDSLEVESIVSLERSRSIKTSRHSSVNGHKRNLSESISINAQNKGMFISEATEVVLSTPDLSKSPANSILRNGKFQPDDASPGGFISDSELYDGIIPVDTGLAASHNTSFSFGSIEEQLNNLTVDSEEENTNSSNSNQEKTAEQVNDDNELMNDIMEFASIIDFGSDIDFDLEGENQEDKLNFNNDSKFAEERVVISIDDESIAATPEINEQSKEHSSDLQTNTIDRKLNQFEDEFENEDFNRLNDLPPTYTEQSDAVDARPASIAHKGLTAIKINSNFEYSPYLEDHGFLQPIEVSPQLKSQKSSLQFSTKIIMYETYSHEQYDRRPDVAACNQLTPQLAQMIKAELNELKSDMEIHEESRCYTHFY